MKYSHKEEYHGKGCSGDVHEHGSHGVPPDAELWMFRDAFWTWED